MLNQWSSCPKARGQPLTVDSLARRSPSASLAEARYCAAAEAAAWRRSRRTRAPAAPSTTQSLARTRRQRLLNRLPAPTSPSHGRSAGLADAANAGGTCGAQPFPSTVGQMRQRHQAAKARTRDRDSRASAAASRRASGRPGSCDDRRPQERTTYARSIARVAG